MKLSEVDTVSETGRFCTCSERPVAVKHISTPAVDASSQAASQPSSYCTCQVGPTPIGTSADHLSIDTDEGTEDATKPIHDKDWGQQRPYCTCRVDQPIDAEPDAIETPADDLPTATDDVAEPIPDELESPVGAGQAETDLARLETPDGEIVLTDRRVVMHGNSDSRTVWASLSIDQVTGARINRTQRGIRGWIWTAVGAAATIAIWQILDGGGWIRLVFPGLVGLSTLVMLFTTLVSPLHLIFSVVGRNGEVIEARISSDNLADAESFGGKVIDESQASATRSAARNHAQASPDPQ